MPRHHLVAHGGPAAPKQVKYEDEGDDSSSSDMKLNLANERQTSDTDADDKKDGERDRSEDEPQPAFDIEAKPTGEEPTPPSGGLVLGGGHTIKLMLVPEPPPAPSPPPPAKEKKPHPQAKMKKFWSNFDPEYNGKITQVLPDRLTDRDLAAKILVGETAHNAVKSYENAKKSCIRDVKRIIKECRDSNQKYTDSHWDIERDLKITRIRDCLDGLVVDDDDKEYPADAKRVTVSTHCLDLKANRPKLGHFRRSQILRGWCVL